MGARACRRSAGDKGVQRAHELGWIAAFLPGQVREIALRQKSTLRHQVQHLRLEVEVFGNFLIPRAGKQPQALTQGDVLAAEISQGWRKIVSTYRGKSQRAVSSLRQGSALLIESKPHD